MVMTLLSAKSWMRAKMSSRCGQNTVEYLLMLTVVVALVFVVGGFLKGDKMKLLFDNIMEKITNTAKDT